MTAARLRVLLVVAVLFGSLAGSALAAPRVNLVKIDDQNNVVDPGSNNPLELRVNFAGCVIHGAVHAAVAACSAGSDELVTPV